MRVLQASDQADWNSIPRMWPNLEILSIRNCDGLTMDVVWDIIAQLNGLKTIHLPAKMSLDEYGRFPCISDQSVKSYSGPPSPIRFIDTRITSSLRDAPDDDYDYRSPPCSFLQEQPYLIRRFYTLDDTCYDSDNSENRYFDVKDALHDFYEMNSEGEFWIADSDKWTSALLNLIILFRSLLYHTFLQLFASFPEELNKYR